jgi:Ser/Thr protein kinase RdoA (MazF antagonist)
MTLLAHAPRLSPAAAEGLAHDLYGLTARAVELPSERDQNFRLQSADGACFVLKIANASEDRRMLEAENAAMRHLAASRLVPVPLPARTGDDIARFEAYHVRLLTHLDGCALADMPRQTESLLADLGRSVGTISRALASFDHPALHRRFYWDLAHAAGAVERDLPRVRDTTLAGAVESLVAVYQHTVVLRLPSLGQSAIHGDLNDYNVLVDAQTSRSPWPMRRWANPIRLAPRPRWHPAITRCVRSPRTRLLRSTV